MSTHDSRPHFEAPQSAQQWNPPVGAPASQSQWPATSYGTPQVFAPRSARARTGLVSLLAVALLSAGVGGGAALSVDRFLDNDVAPVVSTSAEVVQASVTSANPDWAAVAEAISDAVVAIQVSSNSGSGQGSGVILSADGTIVTNNHVIEGGGSDANIRVIIANKPYNAEVVGTDPSTDLAVIRIVDPPATLKTATFADSSKLVVGEPVMAIGNPLGLSDTVTTGIVSALNRPVTTKEVNPAAGDQGNGVVVTAAVQTSAAINPGNSGGALLNTRGELIGITSSIATLSGSPDSPSGSIGIGFAIGSDQVRYITDQLIETGTAKHAQLGVSASDNSTGLLLGAEVSEVVPGSGADVAGLRKGDVVTAAEGVSVTSSKSLVALIRNARVGQEISLTVVRDGQEQQIDVVLGSAEG